MLVLQRPKTTPVSRWERLVSLYMYVRRRRQHALHHMREIRTKQFIADQKDIFQMQLEAAVFEDKPFALLGCSCEKLRSHLETKFDHRMGWHNSEEWHLSYVVPRVVFRKEDEHRAFHYTNILPKWGLFSK